jgi:hypothetical protein
MGMPDDFHLRYRFISVMSIWFRSLCSETCSVMALCRGTRVRGNRSG